MGSTPTPTEVEQLVEIMERVKTWSTSTKIALAKGVLDSLDVSRPSPGSRGRPVAEWIGLGAGASPPPDDDEVRTWIDEHRMGKYG